MRNFMEKKKNIKKENRRRIKKEKTISRFFTSPEAMKKEASSKKLFSFWKTPKDFERAKAAEAPENKFHFTFARKIRSSSVKKKNDFKKRSFRKSSVDGRAFFLFAILKPFYSVFFSLANKIKNIFKKALEKYKVLCEKIKPRFLPAFLRRHYPLFLAIVFLAPAFILIFLFVSSRINKHTSQAAPFTGTIRVSKMSTTLSTAGDWLQAMAFSGDGVNGDGDYFNPIHPGGRADAGGAGTFGARTAALPTTTLNNYDAAGAQFIPWNTTPTGNNYGVILALQNTAAVVNNTNIVVELLRFPTANYTGTPPTVVWSNYVACSAINTCTYAADTVIERRQGARFYQTISGETLYPGQYGIHYLDFRFDPPLAVDTASHYGFRVYYT